MQYLEDLKLDLTIVIPTFNRDDLLIECLKSAINQKSNFSYQIIIVDDNPQGVLNETLSKIISEAPSRINIRFFKNEKNLGVYGNWNRCLQLATTSYVTILNDDDLLKENFLSQISQFLGKYDLVAIDADYINQPIKSFWFPLNWLRKLWHLLVYLKNCVQSVQFVKAHNICRGHPYVASLGVVFLREKALALGGFNAELYPSADYDFFLRYWMVGTCIKLRKPLAYYRWGVNVSLREETLEAWLATDRFIKLNFAREISSGRILRLINKLIDFQANVNARRYSLLNGSFNPKKALQDHQIPLKMLSRSHFFANFSSVLWPLLINNLTILPAARRKRQNLLS